MMDRTCLECGVKLHSSYEIILHNCEGKENNGDD